MTNALWQHMACVCEGTDLTLHPGDDCQCSHDEEQQKEPSQSASEEKLKEEELKSADLSLITSH